MLGLAGEEAVRRPSELWPEFLGVPVPGGDSEMPPLPGYVGFISYDVGRELEPRARWGGGARGDRSIPSMFFRRVEEGLAFDHWKRRWWCVGERARRLARQIEPSGGAGPPGPCWGRPVSQSGQAAYLAGVARALEYIRAGDAYQVNVAHRLSAPFSGGARGVFRGLCAMVRPWHGVYVEGSGFAVASASPEPRSRRKPPLGSRGARAFTALPNHATGCQRFGASPNARSMATAASATAARRRTFIATPTRCRSRSRGTPRRRTGRRSP